MKRITLVSEDKPGKLAEIAEIFANTGINIETLLVETFAGLGVFILTVDQYDEALQALRNTPFQAITEEALLLRLGDRPGALAEIAKRFEKAQINLRSVRIVLRAQGISLVTVSTPRTQEALELVKDVLIS